MDINQTSDTNDSSRVSAELPIVRMPGVIRKPMPAISDNEIYLRFNVPDGLESNGSWPMKYGIVQDAHRDPDGSVIPHNDDDGGVSAKLAAAKAALASANNSNVSPRKSKSAVVRPVAAAPVSKPTTQSGPTLADELEVKRKNVQDYADSNQ